MKKNRLMIPKIIIAIGLVFLFCGSASAYYNPGTPTGYVNDYANILSPTTKASLESGLTQFEQTTKHQISVVTINNLQGDTVENFAVQLFKDWGIGQKGADNGVLFLISKEDRQMRLEVGYGLEGTLTDLQSGQIISQIARPYFQNNDFDGGISASVTAIEKAIQGEPVNTNDTNANHTNNTNFFWVYGFIIFFIIWRVIFSILGKTKSWWLGGVIGAGIGALLGLIWGVLIIIIILAVVLGGVGLLSDWGASRRDWFKNRGGRGGGGIWFLGGGSGRSSGGGFGGFGGGGSGGGGASGGW